MSDLLLFILGVAIFTVTLMAVLWSGYLVVADRFEIDQANRSDPSSDQPSDPASSLKGA